MGLGLTNPHLLRRRKHRTVLFARPNISRPLSRLLCTVFRRRQHTCKTMLWGPRRGVCHGHTEPDPAGNEFREYKRRLGDCIQATHGCRHTAQRSARYTRNLASWGRDLEYHQKKPKGGRDIIAVPATVFDPGSAKRTVHPESSPSEFFHFYHDC